MQKPRIIFPVWNVLANAALIRGYGIDYADAGADETEMRGYHESHMNSGETPEELADWYAEKFGFDTPDEYSRRALKTNALGYFDRAYGKGLADPNHGGALQPGEAFCAGNAGTVVFSTETGEVLRLYETADEIGPDEIGYRDFAKIDVADLRAAFGEIEGQCFDVLDVTVVTTAGQTTPHERARRAELEGAG